LSPLTHLQLQKPPSHFPRIQNPPTPRCLNPSILEGFSPKLIGLGGNFLEGMQGKRNDNPSLPLFGNIQNKGGVWEISKLSKTLLYSSFEISLDE